MTDEDDRTRVVAMGGDDPEHEMARAAVLHSPGLFARKSIAVMMSPHPNATRYWPDRSTLVMTADAEDGFGVKPQVPEGYTSALEMSEMEAKALYGALADYFGHSVHDVRALRRDMEHERREHSKARDALITIALREPVIVPPAPPAPVVNVAPAVS